VLCQLHFAYDLRLFLQALGARFRLVGWVAGIVLVYFGGHMAQSLGNVTERLFRPIEEIVLEGPEGPYRLADQVITACKTKAKDSLKVDADTIKAKWLYRLCDDAVLRSGKLGEREVYIYREGFYRGSAIAFTLLASSTLLLLARLYVSLFLSLDASYWHGWSIALWIIFPVTLVAAVVCFLLRSRGRWLRWLAAACSALCVAVLVLLLPRTIFGQHPVDVDGWEQHREILWFLFAVTLGCSYLSFRRYRRFGMYRVTQAMLGFLNVKDEKKADSTAKEPTA
jgi:hypothetical protein